MLNRRLIIIAAAIGLSSCAVIEQVRDQAQVDPVVASERQYRWAAPTALIRNCSAAQWIQRATDGLDCHVTPPHGRGQEFAPPIPRNPVIFGNRVELRNSVQAELMTMSDLICRKHTASIYGTQSGVNFLTSWFAALLSGAAAITTDRAASNLAAAGAMSGTTRGLVNSEIYFSYVAPAVISEIDLIRGEARQRLHRKRVCSLVTYPPAEAINDALNYHEMCSFVVGLSSLLRKAGVEQRVGDPAASTLRTNISLSLESIRSEERELESRLAAASGDAALTARLTNELADRRLRRGEIERIQVFLAPAPTPLERSHVALNEQTRLFDEAIQSTTQALATAADADKPGLQTRLAELRVKRSELVSRYALDRSASIADLVNGCVPPEDAPVALPN